MKKCRHCGEMYDALAWQLATSDYECTPCRRIRRITYRAARRAQGRPVISGQYSSEQRKVWASQPGNKLKNATRARTRRAIKNGTLNPMPCAICGAGQVEAHHDDYSDHLRIRWLCKQHHELAHIQATGQ